MSIQEQHLAEKFRFVEATAMPLEEEDDTVAVEEDIKQQHDWDEERATLVKQQPHMEKKYFGLTRKNLTRILCFGIAALLAIIILAMTSIFEHQPPARRALALFMFVATLWTTEAIPLYSTSLLIPILIVTFRVICDENGEAISAPLAAKEVMSQLFSETVLVALGAFTMSLAFSKWNLSYRLATAVLSRVGTKPWVVMLTVMFLGWFLSMWMNNVASPVVVVSIVKPMLDELGAESVYARVLLLGIAYSNNIGGMTTPIASPQNLVAVQYINKQSWNTTTGVHSETINWGSFLAVSLPYSLSCILAAFIVLWAMYRPTITAVNPVPHKKLEPFSKMHVFVLVICGSTIILWAVESQIKLFIGSNGIIALIPVVLFFTFPVLEKSDFKELSWDVLMLLAGGLALGDAISSSGLLKLMAESLSKIVAHSGLWVAFFAFSAFIWIFANFISHTVAAIIVLPVIAEVGCTLGNGDCQAGHFAMLVLGCVLVDSGAMSLPVTSFPNAQCYGLEDKEQRRFLTTTDFVKTGFPIGVIEVGLVMTVGYAFLMLVNL